MILIKPLNRKSKEEGCITNCWWMAHDWEKTLSKCDLQGKNCYQNHSKSDWNQNHNSHKVISNHDFKSIDFKSFPSLENTITNVSNWMSSNFLSLNPSKTEFLIFGLQQLTKLDNPTIYLPNNVILSPDDSACNLGVIFDKNLSFAKHIFYF